EPAVSVAIDELVAVPAPAWFDAVLSDLVHAFFRRKCSDADATAVVVREPASIDRDIMGAPHKTHVLRRRRRCSITARNRDHCDAPRGIRGKLVKGETLSVCLPCARREPGIRFGDECRGTF